MHSTRELHKKIIDIRQAVRSDNKEKAEQLFHLVLGFLENQMSSNMESAREEDFAYGGMIFTPLKQLNREDTDYNLKSKRITDTGMTPPDWNLGDFYARAKQVNAGHIDLFRVNGKTVIPSVKTLYVYE